MQYILIIPFLKGLYFFLLMLQLDHYKINSPFKYIKTYILKTPYIVITYLLIFTILNNIYLNLIIYSFILVVSLLKNKYIIKLKFTKRIIRIFTLSIVLSFCLIYFFNNLYTLLILIYLLPLIIFLINLILLPLESLIKSHYKAIAKRRLKKINPFVICITGSFGKTSVKDFLYNIYKDFYITVKTPLSYNTPMGISKTILKDLNNLTEIFITEAGASHVGDIKEITKMVDPNLGIITSVGPQHLDTFKSLDNVLKTKWELSLHMKSSSSLILNYNSSPLNGLFNKDLKENISVNNVSSTYYAKNIVQKDDLTSFDIFHKNNFLLHIDTHLLGRHNIDNLVICYAVKKVLDKNFPLSDEEFKSKVLELTNPPHRLSLKVDKRLGVNFRYLDDAYNSNLEGFLSAVKTLKNLEGIKTIITPGLVDTGKYTDSLSEKLSECLKDLDEVIIIESLSSKMLIKNLKYKGYKYITFKSLKDSLNYLYKKYESMSGEYINILLENDLPDNYLKR